MGVRSEASVVVATRNRRELLGDLLTSLAACDPLPGEVVVVDDAGDVALDQATLGPRLPFRLRTLRIDRCIGPGAARNRGVHASRGDVLLFTDDDCIVHPSWVGALVTALEARPDDRLGGIGGRVLARDQDLISRYLEFHRILEPRSHDARNPRRVPYLVTANCAIRRDVYMRAGGFDGRIPAAGGEDAALSMRIVRSGYYFEREEQAVVEHRFRRGLREFSQTFYRYGLGGRYVVDRYLPC